MKISFYSRHTKRLLRNKTHKQKHGGNRPQETWSTLHDWAAKLMKQKNTPTEANRIAITLTHLQNWAEKITNKRSLFKEEKGFRNTNVDWNNTRTARLGTQLKWNTLAQEKGRMRVKGNRCTQSGIRGGDQTDATWRRASDLKREESYLSK